MRILMVHNRYQIRGGEEECFEADVQLLRQHGHTVDLYEETNDHLHQLKAYQIAAQTVWSQPAYQHVQDQLISCSYDVMHVQNFFPRISPSVYYAARLAGVPVIQTLHNYRLLCPNGLFYRDGQVCTECLGKTIPYPGIQHQCYRNSLSASVGVATMLSIHNLLQTWQKSVDHYIALTNFAQQAFIDGGLPAAKITVKPHFIAPDPGIGIGQGGYFLYVGRLSVEKGLDTLLAAWERLDPSISLKIVGDGQLSEQLESAVCRLNNVEWLGRRPMAEVHDLMGHALALVFPSKWYETFGRVAVEAFAKGTPVIASNLGAIAEVVKSDYTGLHFHPGDPEDLARQVKWVIENPPAVQQMRCNARAEFEAKYTAEANYQMLMDIYGKAKLNHSAQGAHDGHR